MLLLMNELVQVVVFFSLLTQLVVLRLFQSTFFQFHGWLPLEMSMKSTKQTLEMRHSLKCRAETNNSTIEEINPLL